MNSIIHKISIILGLFIWLVYVSTIPVNAGGGYCQDGTNLMYRVDDISIKDKMLNIKGWAYQDNESFDYVSKGTKNNQHEYQLEINGKRYQDIGDYAIDHTYLNSATGHKLTSYKAVGFHFTIPLDALTNTNSTQFTLKLWIRHQSRPWTTISLSYMNLVDSIKGEGYTIEFHTSKNPVSIYTDSNYLLVRQNPVKDSKIQKDRNGNNLYFTRGDIYSFQNQTLLKDIRYDALSEVYWYPIRYKVADYDGQRKRVVASSGGTQGWICDAHVFYVGAPVKITVTKERYLIHYHGEGGTNVPTQQSKEHGKQQTLSSIKPEIKGKQFVGWATNPNGLVKYLPGEVYKEDKDIDLYAIYSNGQPIIQGPYLTNMEHLPSGIQPFIDDEQIIIQKGDQVDIKDFYRAYDDEDGNITNQITQDTSLNTNVSGTYHILLSVTDQASNTTTKEVTVRINNPPQIKTKTKWIIENQKLTSSDVLNKITATDLEDGVISNHVQITSITYEDGTTVINPSSIDTTKINGKFQKTSTIQVQYEVTDHYKKRTMKKDQIIIFYDYSKHHQIQTTRFINKEMLTTLDSQSLWKTNRTNFQILETTLQKQEPKQAYQVFHYTNTQMKNMQQWIRGTNPSTQSNQQFIEQFLGKEQ